MSKKTKKKKTNKIDMNTRRKATLESMKFNRFLMVRYWLAVFLFSNFTWTYLAWGSLGGWISLILLLVAIPAMLEMGSIYYNPDPKYKWTRMFYWMQLVVCASMCIFPWIAPLQFFFPFFEDILAAKFIVLGINALGLTFAVLVVRRLSKIDKGIDKQNQRIQFLATKYKVR